MLDWRRCLAVERSPEGGQPAWLFKGTGVPVSVFFESLKDGAQIDDFLERFPSVSREQAEEVVTFMEDYAWLTSPPVGRELI